MNTESSRRGSSRRDDGKNYIDEKEDQMLEITLADLFCFSGILGVVVLFVGA